MRWHALSIRVPLLQGAGLFCMRPGSLLSHFFDIIITLSAPCDFIPHEWYHLFSDSGCFFFFSVSPFLHTTGQKHFPSLRYYRFHFAIPSFPFYSECRGGGDSQVETRTERRGEQTADSSDEIVDKALTVRPSSSRILSDTHTHTHTLTHLIMHSSHVGPAALLN